MTTAKRQPTILWLQVWGLASVQAAIALTWVIYHLYLKVLLTQFGFPDPVATGILILENLLLSVIEPIMGSLSDRTQQSIGTRFPFISIGVILASACFIAIASIAVFGATVTGIFRWILPVMLVAWALAMAIFRSPVLSLLGQYASATQLPQAASILTLAGAMVGAIVPHTTRLILQLGPGPTFAIGSIVLLVAAAILRTVHSSTSLNLAASPIAELTQKLSITRLALVFGVGLGVTVGFRLMMQTFPKVLQTQIPEANANLLLSLVSVAIVLAAIPSGILATRIGGSPAMLLGLSAMTIESALLLFVNNVVIAVGLAIGLGTAFSLVSNGSIPFALSMVPSRKAGLGTGIFFSGGAIGINLFSGVSSSGSIASSMSFSSGAFLLASVCIICANYCRLKNI